MSGWRHWCPKGCGKSVIYLGNWHDSKREGIFYCQRCGNRFKKRSKELFLL